MDGSDHTSTISREAGTEPVLLGHAMEPMLPLVRTTLPARFAHPVCVALAASLHVAVGAYLVSGSATELGRANTTFEAVAVELVEATPTIVALQQIGSDGSVNVTEDAPESAAPQSPAASAVPPPKEPETPPVVEDTVAAVPAAPPPIRVPEREMDPPPDNPPEETTADAQPSAAAPAQQASMQIIAVGEASQGVVNAYGTELMQIISKGRPNRKDLQELNGARPKGTVIIEFVVAMHGGLEHVAVNKTSGDPRIDRLALAALQRLRFPAPGHDMTIRQRTFTVPYVLR